MEKSNVCEVGLKLDKDLKFYHKMLIEKGFSNVFNCETWDRYWSNKEFDGMSENEIKRACVRFRCSRWLKKRWFSKNNFANSGFQNYLIFDNLAENSFMCPMEALPQFEEKFKQYGWKMVFDTKKKDYQYSIEGMKSRIQLQDIEGIGLLVYYDNPDYYDLPIEEQRVKLIDELNSYGFSFKHSDLGLDKLKTLYHKKDCFSPNQNG